MVQRRPLHYKQVSISDKSIHLNPSPMKLPVFTLCALASTSLLTFADVTVSTLFSDHMVIQRDIAAPVWGQASPGEEISVRLGGGIATKATTDAKGNWSLKIPAQKANASGQELEIRGKNTVAFKDVLVGDVWVCSGQSNMEWTLGGCNAPDDIKAADFPWLRRIKFNHVSLLKPSMQVPSGGWEACTPQTAGNFTAVGFYFAKRIQKEIGVPIGLLDDNWGGCRIEPWIPTAGFELEPSLAPMLADLKKRDEASASLPDNAPGDGGQPSTMYNGMLHCVVPFGIKGALWYQGESNGGEGDEYAAKMRALVGGWRKIWNQGDFPFYYVQLANFEKITEDPAGGDGWARHRMAQLQSLSIPNTGMAVIIDVGEGPDIHPKNKFDVGERLAAWALHDTFGKKDVVPSGPLFKEMKIDGNKAVISFNHLGGGLMVGKKEGREPTKADASGKLQRFAIAGEDKKWVWADAVITGDTVVVSSPEVPKPVAVRYAFSMHPAGCNLYNKAGLPASPFRTDNW